MTRRRWSWWDVAFLLFSTVVIGGSLVWVLFRFWPS